MSEPDVSDLLTVQQAIAVLDAVAVTPRVEAVPLTGARGMVLAEDLVADRDYPPFDKSLMDGYAVRAGDVARTPVALRVVGEVAAGQEAARALGAGEAYAIMTGAPIPPGAEGVVPVEDTAREGDSVRVMRAGDVRRFVARRGADVAGGVVVLRRGVRIEAAQIAVAATVGAGSVRVHPRPRVAVLSTGDELVGVGATPDGARIRNSNGPMLTALLSRLGCEAEDVGVCRDDPGELRAAMERALAGRDVLFVSGGMSMGAYDYVPRLLVEMGFDLRITKLRIKPGKPFVFGVREGSGFGVQGSGEEGSSPPSQFVFGLPGNPVSGFACTVRLASRLIARLAGAEVVERWVVGALAEGVGANGPREFYQPVRMEWGEGGVRVWPLAWKGSADLFTLAAADGLMVRGENEPARGVGEAVRVMAL
jgi:molybdopterin molybdotransferase